MSANGLGNEQFRVVPTDAALGAVIECGDLRTLDEGQVQAVRQAWLDNLVVVFREQQFSDADLIAFGRKFGDFQYSKPLPSPLATKGDVKQGGRFEEHPEITVVSNVVENGIAAGGLGDGEVLWHTDMSNFEIPPNQTVLYAIETPIHGGRTGFCNMYLALDRLPKAMRSRIEGLKLKHDSLTDAAGYVRKEYQELSNGDIRTTPGAVHPLICTHPETNKDCLYLGRRSKAYIVGLDLIESEALLNALWQHVGSEELFWFHEWRPGDVIMWDNRCTMHRREPFDAGARRTMHRVVIKGSSPVYRAAGGGHARGRHIGTHASSSSTAWTGDSINAH